MALTIEHKLTDVPMVKLASKAILKGLNAEPREKKEPVARFTPPTYDQVREYFFEKIQDEPKSINEAEKFMDFYGSKGWMIGKNKMKDFKGAVRNWCKGLKEQTGQRKTAPEPWSEEALNRWK